MDPAAHIKSLHLPHFPLSLILTRWRVSPNSVHGRRRNSAEMILPANLATNFSAFPAKVDFYPHLAGWQAGIQRSEWLLNKFSLQKGGANSKDVAQ